MLYPTCCQRVGLAFQPQTACGWPALEICLGVFGHDYLQPCAGAYLGHRGSSRLLRYVRNRADTYKEMGVKVTQITPLSWHRC